jgi:translation initiation factor 3 subunit C
VIEGLKSLLESAKSPYQRSRVLLALIPAQFDFSTSSGSGFMPTEAWHRYKFKYVNCFSLAQNISTIMQLFEENKNLVITEGVEAPEDDLAENKKAEDGEKVELLGNLGSFVDRLDEEFRKSMQQLDPHTKDFVARLKDEDLLYGLIVRSQSHYIVAGRQDDFPWGSIASC